MRDLYGFRVSDASTCSPQSHPDRRQLDQSFCSEPRRARVVYSTYPPGDSASRDLFVVDLHSPQNAVRLNEQPSSIVMNSGAGTPEFSPDDQWIAYVGRKAVGIACTALICNPGTSVELTAVAPEGQVFPATYRNRFAFVPEPAKSPIRGSSHTNRHQPARSRAAWDHPGHGPVMPTRSPSRSMTAPDPDWIWHGSRATPGAYAAMPTTVTAWSSPGASSATARTG